MPDSVTQYAAPQPGVPTTMPGSAEVIKDFGLTVKIKHVAPSGGTGSDRGGRGDPPKTKASSAKTP